MIPWESCVLWLGYPLQNGLWPDVSKHNNNGVITGVFWEGDNLEFDGIDDYVNCGNDVSLRSSVLSAFVWVKPLKVINERKALFANGNLHAYATNNYACEVYGETIRIYGRTPSASISSTSVLTAGEWIHIGFVNNGSTTKIYADKTEVGSGLQTLGTDNTNSFLISAMWNNFDIIHHYNAQISQVRIYNKAFTAQQVKEAYEQSYRLV